MKTKEIETLKGILLYITYYIYIWYNLLVINYLCWLIDTEKELLSKLKEKDQEIEILKESVTSLTAEDKIIQQGMYQFIIYNHSLSDSKNKDEINKFVLSDMFIYVITIIFF